MRISWHTPQAHGSTSFSKTQPTLFMFIGLPRSGKSTLADELSKLLGATIVCPDDVRASLYGAGAFIKPLEPLVWTIADAMVEATLKRSHWCILDATNVTVARRAKYYAPGLRTVALFVDTEPLKCLGRADEDTLWDRSELRAVIEHMRERLEPPGQIEHPHGPSDVWNMREIDKTPDHFQVHDPDEPDEDADPIVSVGASQAIFDPPRC